MLGKIIKVIVFASLLSHLTACGTVLTLTAGDYGVYTGVEQDFHWIKEGGVLCVLGVIDLPLSFVLDTLMLPVTLSQ